MVVRGRVVGDGIQLDGLLRRGPCVARPCGYVAAGRRRDRDRASRATAATSPERAHSGQEVGKPDPLDQFRTRARVPAHLPVPPARRLVAVGRPRRPFARLAVRGAGVAREPFVTHPRNRIDELIHSPVRLSVMSALRAADEVHFALLRDTLEVSDSLLSKHVAALEDAGYVEVTKGYAGKRPRTWYTLTDRGQHAYDEYV